jgi:ATP-binding cassette subfamily B protein
MIWYLIALGYVVNLYQRGTASLKRFNAILETAPTIKDDQTIQVQPPIKGAVEFRNLNFAYNGKPVLEDIDLDIAPGQTVAFVGKTGSGKSTLMNLVPRLLDAPDGTVLIDGKPVREFPLHQLRRAIGFVPQETFLFSDTLAENIAFGVDSGNLKAESAHSSGAEHQLSAIKGQLSVESAAATAGLGRRCSFVSETIPAASRGTRHHAFGAGKNKGRL